MGVPVSTAKRVAIVGAGWSGLQIAEVLRDCGYDVTLFEALDDVGGTWHPATAYAGLSIHTPAFRATFHDYPFPADVDPLERLPAQDIFAYCRAFARDRGLVPLIRFRHRVLSLDYRSGTRRCVLTVADEASGRQDAVEFDFVVSTQFNAPRPPRIDRAGFTGEVLHSNDLKPQVVDRLVGAGADLVLLGAGKAATDIALELSRRGVGFRWLMRRMYWFLAYDKVYRNVVTGRPARPATRLLYLLGIGLARTPLLTRLVFRAWRATGVIVCPGRVHSDYNKFHHGWLDQRQLKAVAALEQTEGEPVRLKGRSIVLADGRRFPCDALIAATGCDPIAVPVALSVDGVPLDYRAVPHVYRMSVIPSIPRLCFTGYWMFGFGPLNGYHRAAWIMRHLEQDPSAETLARIAEEEAAAPGANVFRDGNILFDGGHSLIEATAKNAHRMLEGIASGRDLRRYYIGISLRHVFRPLAGVERFIAARRRGGRATAAADGAQASRREKGRRP